MKVPSPRDLRSWAIDEQWNRIDRSIPSIARDPVYFEAAKRFLSERNSHVRDLGASILQKAPLSSYQFRSVAPLLLRVMSHSQTGNYDGFRAACAIVVHSSERALLSKAQAVLKEFTADQDVGAIARGYLGALRRKY